VLDENEVDDENDDDYARGIIEAELVAVHDEL